MSDQQTPAGWYPDPDDVTQQRYWDGAQWTEHRARAAAVNYGQAAEIRSKSRKRAFIVIGVVAGLVALVAIGSSLSSDSTPTAQSSAPAPAESTEAATAAAAPATYKARITNAEVLNPATIRFDAVVKRPASESDQQDSPVTCTVRFSDASGTYKGFDFFDADILAYSSRRLFGGNIIITNEGAAFVTDYSIECKERS